MRNDLENNIEKIKQFSIDKNGLLMEYIDNNGGYNYLRVCPSQISSIISVNFEFDNCEENLLSEDNLKFLREKILRGYPIRFYDYSGLIYKCKKLFIEINNMSNKNVLQNILLQARELGVFNIYFYGDIFSYSDMNTIIVFSNNNNLYSNIFSDCYKCENINSDYLRLINRIYIDDKISSIKFNSVSNYFNSHNLLFEKVDEKILRDKRSLKINSQYDVFYQEEEVGNIQEKGLKDLWILAENKYKEKQGIIKKI
jgi:hypothetical protein